MKRPWLEGQANKPAFKRFMRRMDQLRDHPDESDRLLARLRAADGPFILQGSPLDEEASMPYGDEAAQRSWKAWDAEDWEEEERNAPLGPWTDGSPSFEAPEEGFVETGLTGARPPRRYRTTSGPSPGSRLEPEEGAMPARTPPREGATESLENKARKGPRPG